MMEYMQHVLAIIGAHRLRRLVMMQRCTTHVCALATTCTSDHGRVGSKLGRVGVPADALLCMPAVGRAGPVDFERACVVCCCMFLSTNKKRVMNNGCFVFIFLT
jgi:hypothetical protein